MRNSDKYEGYEISFEDEGYINSLSPEILEKLPKYQEIKENKCKYCKYRKECYDFKSNNSNRPDNFYAKCYKFDRILNIITRIVFIILIPICGYMAFKNAVDVGRFRYVVDFICLFAILILIVDVLKKLCELWLGEYLEKLFYKKRKKIFEKKLNELKNIKINTKLYEMKTVKNYTEFRMEIKIISDESKRNLKNLLDIILNIYNDYQLKDYTEQFKQLGKNCENIIKNLEEFQSKIDSDKYLKTIPFYKVHLFNFTMHVKNFTMLHNEKNLNSETIETFIKLVQVFDDKFENFIQKNLDQENELTNTNFDKNNTVISNNGGDQ